jgi:hypothetical protein
VDGPLIGLFTLPPARREVEGEEDGVEEEDELEEFAVIVSIFFLI